MGEWTVGGQADTAKTLTFAESRIVGLGDDHTVLSFSCVLGILHNKDLKVVRG